ncbi:MAG: class I SAM-dependent methyltransferase [Candidatus Binatia bacterium]|nr:class I SAM-dependent methyltransferase [Candidatus Binatia bacterium]
MGDVPELIYDEGYFGGDSFGGYPAYLDDRQLIVDNFARRVNWLEPHAQGKRLLDVGAAYGFLVQAAGEAGFDAVGLEPAAGCVEWARRELGISMLAGTVEEAVIEPESFDVVTLMDVIEHVADPGVALRQIRRWLRPGGMVVIETGDFEALLPRVVGSRWYYYDPPQHLTYFSPSSIETLLVASGFDAPVAVGHLGRSVSVRNFSFQLGRALGDGIWGNACRSLASSALGAFTFDVPDRGNVMAVAARVRSPG